MHHSWPSSFNSEHVVCLQGNHNNFKCVRKVSRNYGPVLKSFHPFPVWRTRENQNFHPMRLLTLLSTHLNTHSYPYDKSQSTFEAVICGERSIWRGLAYFKRGGTTTSRDLRGSNRLNALKEKELFSVEQRREECTSLLLSQGIVYISLLNYKQTEHVGEQVYKGEERRGAACWSWERRARKVFKYSSTWQSFKCKGR